MKLIDMYLAIASTLSAILLICKNQWVGITSFCGTIPHNSEFMGKKFQAAQVTHERFLTIDHSCKIFF